MSDGIANIGFVGLGNMGTPMSSRLVEAGFVVHAYDISSESRERAREAGATPVETVQAAAKASDAIVLMLPNSTIVASVIHELLSLGALRGGLVIIDMSSSEPTATRELAGELAAAGVDLVDAPVSGGVKGAVNGTLTIMTGGEDAALQRVAPVFAPLGRVVRAGSVGAGHAVKALNNLLSATHLWVTSEVMVAGQRFGLEPQVMLDIFNASSGRSGSTENKWPNFILPATFDSGFGLQLMLKDMIIAVGLADETGTPSRLGADAVQLWSEAADGLPPSADHTEVAKWIAMRAPKNDPVESGGMTV